MKKLIFTTAFAFVVLFANAQLKVYTSGKTYMGGTSTTPLSMLSVGGAGGTTIQGYFYNSLTNGGAATKGEMATGTSGNNYGVIGRVPSGNSNAYGVQGDASNASTQTGGISIGVYGIAGNAVAGSNYGMWGRLNGSNNGAGMYSNINSTASTIPGQYSAYFEGNIRTTDATPEKPTDAYWTVVSCDLRVKKDITDFKDGLNVLREINPVNFKYNGIGGMPINTTNIGIIAQDVQMVAPYCVGKSRIILKDSEKSAFASDILETIKNDSLGDQYVAEILNYNPNGLFYVMINSIKQLDSTVTDLQAQLNAAKGQRTNNDNTQGKTETTLQIELANNSEIILYQNEPNPFNGSTVIRYFIPENISGSMYISFTDLYGKEIKKLELKEKGFGKIEASTENLASGIYSYSMMVNEKVIDTKKMMKNK